MEQFEPVQQVEDNTVYYVVSSNVAQQVLEKQDQNFKDLQNQINKVIDEDCKNIIQYTNHNYLNFVMKSNIEFKKDYILIDQKTADKLQPILNIAFPAIKYSSNQQSTILLKLIPLYQGQKNYIEGVQQFDRSWTVEEAIANLEDSLQKQILLQVPSNNFIKLYQFKQQPTTFTHIIEQLNNRTVEIEQVQGNLNTLMDNQFILLDIQLINKEYYFTNNKQKEDEEDLKITEYSKKGKSIFENQSSLKSCQLKCYECLDKIRETILNGTNHPLKSILKQSYYGSYDNILYDLNDFVEQDSTIIKISPNILTEIIFNYTPIEIVLTFSKTFQNILNELTKNSNEQYILECSNNYFTKSICLNAQSNQVEKDYKLNFRKLIENEQVDDCVEITVVSTIAQNDGILTTYSSFKPIRKCFVPYTIKFQDLHLIIANLFEPTNFEDYKQYIANKKYELIFQTNQDSSALCQYCNSKLCNNCIVPFTDKKITFKSNKVIIYALFKNLQQQQEKQSILIKDGLNIIDYLKDFNLQKDYQIFTIDDSQIYPNLINYSQKWENYTLKAIISKEYNCYCQIETQWIKFSNNGCENVEFPNNLRVFQLFYVLD